MQGVKSCALLLAMALLLPSCASTQEGGYLSHTLWCVMNRFALDRPPNATVKGSEK